MKFHFRHHVAQEDSMCNLLNGINSYNNEDSSKAPRSGCSNRMNREVARTYSTEADCGSSSPSSSFEEEKKDEDDVDGEVGEDVVRPKGFFRLKGGRRPGQRQRRGTKVDQLTTSCSTSATTAAAAAGGECCSSSDDEPPQVSGAAAIIPRRRGIASAIALHSRPPRMRRTQSLPNQIPPPVILTNNDSIIPTNTEDTNTCTIQQCLSDDGGILIGIGTTNRHERHVTFTSVQIREYSTILGDHPCCPSGPPLSLGWTMEREDQVEFETYESEREPWRVRTKEELRLDGNERRGILRSLVVSGGGGSEGHNAAISSAIISAAVATTPADDEGISSSWYVGGDGRGDIDNDIESQAIILRSQEEGKGKGDDKICCCMYSEEEIRKAERKLTRERACNSRANRRMNRGFFRPLSDEERDRGTKEVIIDPSFMDEDNIMVGDISIENLGEGARLAPLVQPDEVLLEPIQVELSSHIKE